ncbi:MAG: D-alanyl-D-alanine carboxypeptidase [Clostridia bacterium]|nr:D-alanyl-D-alanine carboxypeptidase [Clostridia bacterium]
MKKIICTLVIFTLIFNWVSVFSKDISNLESGSIIMMDQATGKVLYEKNADFKCEIASVTKIMTALLLMEEIDKGNIKYTDMITTSEYAESMGGSQLFLKVGEQMSVDDMLKGLMINSGNDAAVAIAEHVSGSEEAFVERMNVRAKELGMNNTMFRNSNGLPEDNQYSTARDVALMSRELMKNHPDIKKYTTIWMDSLRGGELLLSNTNKLMSPAPTIGYQGATGLKTGYTDSALHCLSATAERDKVGLVTVILGAQNSDLRFDEAKILFDYGFKNFTFKEMINKGDVIKTIPVIKGNKETVNAVAKNDCAIFDIKNVKGEFTTEIDIAESIKAPFEKGHKLGVMRVKKGDTVMGEVELVSDSKVNKRNLLHILKLYFEYWLGIK